MWQVIQSGDDLSFHLKSEVGSAARLLDGICGESRSYWRPADDEPTNFNGLELHRVLQQVFLFLVLTNIR